MKRFSVSQGVGVALPPQWEAGQEGTQELQNRECQKENSLALGSFWRVDIFLIWENTLFENAYIHF